MVTNVVNINNLKKKRRMNKREINYSIIIPHHNLPVLLQRLLYSIPERDDLEVIIVDDNSSSEYVDFNNFPGQTRKNTHIIFDKKGGFGGYARNLGLQIAKGKWLLFADSDDFFNYCIGDILNDYRDSTKDVVFFKANSLDTDSYTISNRCNSLNKLIDLWQINPIKSELALRYDFGEPWCKLIKRSLIKDNNIWFEESSIHNDTEFSYKVGYYAKNISVDSRALYCVTTREGSVSKVITEKKKLERIQTFGKSERFFKNHNVNKKTLLHYKQLIFSFFSNKETYNLGFSILRNIGFSKAHIYLSMLLYPINLMFSKIKN